MLPWLILLLGAEAARTKPINVCYFTNWAQYRAGAIFTPAEIDANLCTHINYAFSFVTDDGTGLRIFEWNDITLYAQDSVMKNTTHFLATIFT